MIEELQRVDKIARYYFLIASFITLFIAVSALTGKSFNYMWLALLCFGISFLQFIAGVGLLQRKKWGLVLARYYVNIFHPQGFPFSSVPVLTVWLHHIKDRQLDAFFR